MLKCLFTLFIYLFFEPLDNHYTNSLLLLIVGHAKLYFKM